MTVLKSDNLKCNPPDFNNLARYDIVTSGTILI